MGIGYDTGFERFSYRICLLNKKRGGVLLSRILSIFGRLIWPCDIDPGAILGRHIRIPHAVGIVVGSSAVIEDDVTIFSGVVIGTPFNSDSLPSGCAHIGRGTVLGANCVILGPVYIGECSKIGAGTVVTKDVPAYSSVIGINHVLK